MPIKKIISIAIVLLTLLSAREYFLQNQIWLDTGNPYETQLAEDPENIVEEFRETTTLKISGGVKTRTQNYTCLISANTRLTNRPIHSRCRYARIPPKLPFKLFIELRALII